MFRPGPPGARSCPVLTVVLYGNSLALAGVGASLAGHPEVQVLRLAATDRPSEELLRLEPDVVVFDLATAQPDVVTLLRQHRRVLPVGVDLEAHQAVVFTGRSSRALTADDLLRVIESRVGAARHAARRKV